MLKIEIFSDAICPWCFIGKRRLEHALQSLDPGVHPQIAWRAFELNPAMPKDGTARKAYRIRKFGSLEKSQALESQVARAGEEQGIAFNFDAIERTPNTVLAHQLISFAGEHNLQDSVVERIFRAYFLEGQNIGDVDVLTGIATAAGIDREIANDVLRNDRALDSVRSDEERARRLGISGVPFFVVNERYGVSGAQPPDALTAVFQQALAETHPASLIA